ASYNTGPASAVHNPAIEAQLGARWARFCTVNTTMIIDGSKSGPSTRWMREPSTTRAAEATGFVRRIVHGAMCSTRMLTTMVSSAQSGQLYMYIGKVPVAEPVEVRSISPNSGRMISPSAIRGYLRHHVTVRSKNFTAQPYAAGLTGCIILADDS